MHELPEFSMTPLWKKFVMTGASSILIFCRSVFPSSIHQLNSCT